MFHGSGSPRPSCRLSGKLGRDGSGAFRSVPFRSVPFRSVPFRSVPFRLSCRRSVAVSRSLVPLSVPCRIAVSQIIRPVLRVGRRGDGREASGSVLPFARPSHIIVGAVPTCSPLCQSRSAPIGSQLGVSGSGAGGNEARFPHNSTLSDFPCRLGWSRGGAVGW